ncbi:MAG: HAD family phosphatase [Bacteroidales bacterium]|nr:HAD family phosphatase [Bacteroidales bacterium]
MIDLSGIKNIIFDFGGVIININPKLTINALKELGVYQAGKLLTNFNVTSILHDLELGKISNHEFLLYLKQQCTKDVSLHEITQAWNAMLLDIPQQRIQLLQHLKQFHKIFLLSNTNAIHFKQFNNTFLQATQGISFQQMFDKVYFSYEIKLRKPSIEIFKYVLDDQQLNPTETLFIDDSIENIETAKMLNIRTYWLTNELTDNFALIKV